MGGVVLHARRWGLAALRSLERAWSREEALAMARRIQEEEEWAASRWGRWRTPRREWGWSLVVVRELPSQSDHPSRLREVLIIH